MLTKIREAANKVVFDGKKDIFDELENLITKILEYAIKAYDEFKGYSKNVKITLFIIGFLIIGFVVSVVWVLGWGLGYTDMNNTFTWGAWIAGDLGLVAIGGGCFFTGYLLYIFRIEKLAPLMNSSVLLGFLCYLFTLILLAFDVGQPLRFWFGFVYPNWGDSLMPNSMLTEVFWCLTLYFFILIIELIPIPLKHRVLDKHPVIHKIGHYMHEMMWIAAAVGTFLSFFHQASLGGGMWGELYGKAAWFRPHFFFLAVAGAMAGGTAFMTLCPWIAQKITKKELVPRESFLTISKIAGIMFIFYFAFRSYDIYSMVVTYAPAFDRNFVDLWGGYYGLWMLVVEMGLYAVPLVLLNIKKYREQENLMAISCACGAVGVIWWKLNVILHGFSTPNFPWRDFMGYNPTFQEWFITLGSVAIMILVYMAFTRYIPLFPHAEGEGEGDAH